MQEFFNFNLEKISSSKNEALDREKNLQLFLDKGFPNKKDENWKFSDLKSIVNKNFKSITNNYDFETEKKIDLKINDQNDYSFRINLLSFDELLEKSDFVTLHVPAQEKYIIGKNEFKKMKNGSAIINASRGGIIDEVELIRNLDIGKIKFAGLDTFENEPDPSVSILMHPKISLTPHIGAATSEAQERIGEELAKQICEYYIK